MEELFKKLTQYQIFNYLLVGTLFSVLFTITTNYRLPSDNIVATLVIYYFTGLTISRLGSLLVEPVLKRIKFVKFASYKDFLEAAKKDEKIELLSQDNNMYRSLLAGSLLFTIFYIIHTYYIDYVVSNKSVIILIISCLFIFMFMFSYRKQTTYITKRIRHSVHTD